MKIRTNGRWVQALRFANSVYPSWKFSALRKVNWKYVVSLVGWMVSWRRGRRSSLPPAKYGKRVGRSETITLGGALMKTYLDHSVQQALSLAWREEATKAQKRPRCGDDNAVTWLRPSRRISISAHQIQTLTTKQVYETRNCFVRNSRYQLSKPIIGAGLRGDWNSTQFYMDGYSCSVPVGILWKSTTFWLEFPWSPRKSG